MKTENTLVISSITFIVLIIILNGCNKIIRDESIVDPNTPLPTQLYVYGTLLEVNELINLPLSEQGKYLGKLSEFKIRQEIVDCEKVTLEDVAIKAFALEEDISNLEMQTKYLFRFVKFDDNRNWKLYPLKLGPNSDLKSNLKEYRGLCFDNHDYDLITTQKFVERNPKIIETNGITKLDIELINTEDNEIPYTIGDLAIIDEYITYNANRDWKVYPELVREAKVEGCSVSSDESKGIIGPKIKKVLSFNINCDLPDIPNSKNSKGFYFLWGDIIFEDELGFKHKLNGRNQVIQMNLKIGGEKFTDEPTIQESTQDFSMAFILVAEKELDLTPEKINKLSEIKQTFPENFYTATNNLASIDTAYPVSTFVLGDLEDDTVESITKKFYENNPDNFDFISIYTASDNFNSMQTSHQLSQNKIKGIGFETFDRTADFGSNGKLLGVNWIKNINIVSDTGGLLHETGHQWCCYVGDNFARNKQGERLEIIQESMHWYSGLESSYRTGTPMNAHYWVSNGDGTYRRGDKNSTESEKYHPFQLYFMGLYTSDNFDFNKEFIVYDATDNQRAVPYNKISINDIIEVEGERKTGIDAGEPTSHIFTVPSVSP